MVRPVSSRLGLLDCIERYAALAPLPEARIEPAGALDVPSGDPAWPCPARPRPGAGPVSREDVDAAAALQEAAGSPVALEWIGERHPELAAIVSGAGYVVDELPLLVAADPVQLLLPAGFRLYVVGADDPDLPRYDRVADGASGRDRGSAGEPAHGAARTAVLRERIAAGRTVMMVVLQDGEPVAVGSHQPVPVDGQEVSELVGLATLPRLRGHGIGAALASALVAAARQTAEPVFLSAAADDVARVYERVGFARLATTVVATRPAR
jgi:GNAT superfamily N-acetyltransferase